MGEQGSGVLYILHPGRVIEPDDFVLSDFFTHPSLLGLLDEYQKKYGDIFTIYMGEQVWVQTEAAEVLVCTPLTQ